MSARTENHTGAEPDSRAPVVIVGAGPVGLSLALGLAHHGVPSVLLERATHTNTRSRAPGIHLRTREIFRRWGVEESILAEGTLRRSLKIRTQSSRVVAAIDYSMLDPEADRPGVVFLEQARTEKLLLDAVRETGLCDVRFGTEAVQLDQEGERVLLTSRRNGSEEMIEADFVVGCDGASSFTREALGLSFDGATYSIRAVLADIRISDERDGVSWPRIWNGRGGLTVAAHLPDGLWRLMHMQRGRPDLDAPVTASEIEQHVSRTLGGGPFEIEWANRFRLHLRAAPTYRVGRVLLAGDAAHIHSPAGGLGMNAGIQDAHNLAWKLVAALTGSDTERLLASYDVERRSVTVEDVSRHADVMTRAFLQAPSVVRTPLFGMLRLMLAVVPIRRILLRRLTMINLGYDTSPLLRSGSRAAGRRLPNPRLRGPDGTQVRLYDLAPKEAFLIHVADRPGDDVASPLTVIRVGVHAYHEPAGLLRRLTGGRDGWVLVRPDLHIAWTGPDLDGLDEIVRETLAGAAPTSARTSRREGMAR